MPKGVLSAQVFQRHTSSILASVGSGGAGCAVNWHCPFGVDGICQCELRGHVLHDGGTYGVAHRVRDGLLPPPLGVAHDLLEQAIDE